MIGTYAPPRDVARTVHATPSNVATTVGGLSLIAAAVGFVAVFSYLAATFDYPNVLNGASADVLPRLIALGATGRAVWVIYAMLPLLLIPAAIGARSALGVAAPNAMRGAMACGTIAAVSMLIGLARWPSVHWELAGAYATASVGGREAIDAVFRGFNVYLGNYIGEFLGEITLSSFFVLLGYAALQASAARRWFGVSGITVGSVGFIAAFRNVTPTVALVAEANNYLLPVWLVVIGVVLVRWRALTESQLELP
jgi:hypothetical protein